MKLTRILFFLTLLAALVSLPALAGDCPGIEALVLDQAEATAVNEVPAMEEIFLAANRPAPQSKVNLISSNGEINSAEACDWYDIECSNGTTDECCGSQSSCGGYCAEVCGGPCVYEGDQ